ncbi:hypothetical protein GCM10022221_68230 [Actinocorallia aurea]
MEPPTSPRPPRSPVSVILDAMRQRTPDTDPAAGVDDAQDGHDTDGLGLA